MSKAKTPRRFTSHVDRELGKALFVCVEKVKEEAIMLITQSGKSGVVYNRRSVSHQASAPGEPPASDTGRLVSTADARVDFKNLKGKTTFGDSSVSYAAMLEYGTVNMAARPFLFPAGEMSKKFIAERFKRAMRDAAKAAIAEGRST